MDILWFIIGLILFIGLVVVHELGHALVARRNGVEVEEFGIGFPPRAWSKKLKNGTLFSINWLPLGGFVKLKGEHDAADEPGTYGAASLWAKSKILLAGVAMNWLTAVLIFTILALVGMPRILPNQFAVAADNQVSVSDTIAARVGEGSPAEKAGLKTGDTLISIAGEPIGSQTTFGDQTAAHAGQTVKVVYKRDGVIHEADVTLNKERSDKGFIGVSAADRSVQRATWSAPIVGVGVTLQFTYETFAGLFKMIGQLFTAHFSEAGSSVAGPVGIFVFLHDSSTLGFLPVLFLIGVISLTLAVMNLLPIPALDGGRLAVTLLFRALRKNLTKQREEAIQAAGFMFLMALIILVTVVDVRRFF